MPKKKTSTKSAKRDSGPTMKTLRELAEQIAERRDLAGVGTELLSADSESVKARVWETLANWAYGKPAGANGGSGAGAPAVRVIWDIPGPPHETPPGE